MSRKTWSKVALLLVLAMLVTACGTKPAEPPTTTPAAGTATEQPAPAPEPAAPPPPAEALVGVPVPLTGSSAKMGEDILNAINMAFEAVNASGGVLGGTKLKAQAEDDGCDAQMSVSAVNKLVNSGVIAVVGHYCSGAALPNKPIYDRYNLAAILPSANSSKLYTDPVQEMFLVNATANHQATTAQIWLTEKNPFKKIAIVHDNTAYAKDLADLSKVLLEQKGAEIVAFEAIVPGEKDFSPLVTKLKGKSPDAILWTGYYAEGGLIIKQARAAGLKAHIMVGDGSWDPTLVEIAGQQAAEGVTLLTTATAEILPAAQGFLQDYKAKYNQDPGPYSAHAFDAANVLVEAIKKAGSLDREAIAKAVPGVSFEGLTGKMEFKPDGTLTSGYFIVQEVKDGKFAMAWMPNQ